jgi:hypothetical protein
MAISKDHPDYKRAWDAMSALIGDTMISELVMGGEIPRHMYADSLEFELVRLYITGYLQGLESGRGDLAAFMG